MPAHKVTQGYKRLRIFLNGPSPPVQPAEAYCLRIEIEISIIRYYWQKASFEMTNTKIIIAALLLL